MKQCCCTPAEMMVFSRHVSSLCTIKMDSINYAFLSVSKSAFLRLLIRKHKFSYCYILLICGLDYMYFLANMITYL